MEFQVHCSKREERERADSAIPKMGSDLTSFPFFFFFKSLIILQFILNNI